MPCFMCHKDLKIIELQKTENGITVKLVCKDPNCTFSAERTLNAEQLYQHGMGQK